MKIFEPKLLTCFKGYQKKDLVSDIVAGIIVAIIALPLSIALAIASGVDPEQGLYTAIFAGFVIAMFGGSKVNISGPTAAFATIVAGIVADKGMEGLFLATIMAGVILIIMGACKLGTLIKYIPKTITVGFTAGIAVTILIGQIKDFLGLTFPENAHNIETIDKIKNIFNYIGTMDRWEPVAVGVGALVIMIVWSKFIKKIPSSLIVVLIGALAIGLPKVAVATIGDAYPIGSAIPKFIVPSFDGKLILSLLPDAFTIALLAGIESLLSCVVSDNMINDKHNPNTELIAQGLGNICSGFMGGIPATGAIARTANVKNGGKTPLAGMIHAVVLLVVLLLLIPYASLIPMPVIAAILFIVAYNMSEWRVFVKICKTKQVIDIIILCLTFVLTVAFNLVIAIAVGLVLHYAIFFAIKLANKNKEVKAE